MFKRLKNKFSDMRTVARLLEAAGDHARQQGQDRPGSEHFLLAALDLPDGKGNKVMQCVGVEADELREAINSLHKEALSGIGVSEELIAVGLSDVEPPAEPVFPKRAQESAVNLLRRLAHRDSPLPKDAPLTGALIIASVASERHSIAARALTSLDLNLEQLRELALREAMSAN